MLSLTENRLTRAIEAARAKIDALDGRARDRLEAATVLEGDDHFQYQQVQAQAHAAGTIPTDEAQVIYVALGEVGSAENGGWARGTDLATKVVVTQAVAELLQLQIKRRRGF
jgi:hypothetical protein